MFRGDGLGVELDPFQDVDAVTHAHHLTVRGPGRDLELGRQRRLLQGEGVVAREGRPPGYAAEEAAAVERQLLGLAVDDPPRGDDARAERVADGLVAEADPEDRHDARQPADHLNADARLFGPTGPRGDHDPGGMHSGELVHGDPIVAEHLDGFRGKLAQVLVEVVRERIVVVDDGVHGHSSSPSARARAPSFASVSSYSRSGVES